MKGLEGKTVLIAGGAKNLGGLIARDLAAHGAGAIAVHHHDESSLEAAAATVRAIEQAGAKATALQGDLTSAAAMAKLFADATAAVGPIDVAINTTGMVLKKPIVDVTED